MHMKDPVVHVEVRWIMETLIHPACRVGWLARLCCSWLSLGKQLEFPMGEIQMGKYSCILSMTALHAVYDFVRGVLRSTDTGNGFRPYCGSVATSTAVCIS